MIDTKNIEKHLTLNASRIIDPRSPGNSFMAVGGNDSQRLSILTRAIDRVRGKAGIVVLNASNAYERDLNQRYPDAEYIGWNNRIYDPLYMCDEKTVLDMITPQNGNSSQLRSDIAAYLDIMKYHFGKDLDMFGSSPFNLDLLIDLSRMPFPMLEKEVLDHIPYELSGYLVSRLSNHNTQQAVYEAVTGFADGYGMVYEYNGFQGHSHLSVSSCIADNRMIVITVSPYEKELLNNIGLELKGLIRCGVPFALFEVGMDLSDCGILKDLFVYDHSSMNYVTGIIADSLLQTVRMDDAYRALSTHKEAVFFATSNYEDARLISEMCGIYYRNVRDKHYDGIHEVLPFLSIRGHGTNLHEVETRNILPEEIMRLKQGCLAFLPDRSLPLKALTYRY